MKTNKNAVQAKLKKMSLELGVPVNTLLATYFFDAFLLRLSMSRYVENFVFKGGFYLASLIGIQNRYTQDLDFKLTGENLEKQNLEKIIQEILSVFSDDGITFELGAVSPIREEDAYGGFSISIIGHLENIRQSITLDIATGDPVTPSAVVFNYKRFFEESTINFMAYNLETFLAEKLQTVLKRGILNSRSKDFYDIFIIHKLKQHELTVEDLRRAFGKTCAYRKTYFEKANAQKTLSQIKSDELCLLRWKNYAKKNSFSNGISFDEVISACEHFLETIF